MQVKVRIESKEGIPVLMRSLTAMYRGESQDRLKQLTAIRGKKKTPEIQEQIDHLSYALALYYSPDTGPYWPAENIEASLINGAKKHRLGKDVSTAVVMVETRAPLQYEGPRDPDEMYHDPRFVDIRPVDVQGKRVMRIRPKFDQWAADFHLQIDTEKIMPEQVKTALEVAGSDHGLGDFRRRFGRYNVTQWEIIE